MATVTFASKLREDGSLSMPTHAAEELGIHPGDEVRVRVEAGAENGGRIKATALARARSAMIQRTPKQIADAQARAMKSYPPVRSVPSGKTLADVVSGQWPGDESDEVIDAALRELS